MAELDLRELTAVVGKLAAVLNGPDLRRLTSSVALRAKRDAEHALDADLPGRKFTNWRPKLSVGYTVLDDTSATVRPRPSGPWKVLNDGRKAGQKYSRKRGQNVGWGATVGKGTWTVDAAPVIRRETPGRVDKGVQDSIRKALS